MSMILRETADWIAVDKPAGITVIPARGEPPGDCLQKVLEKDRSERLWVVHRIDRETSGVVLFARNPDAHRALSAAFRDREVRKTYLAFTRGLPPEDRGTVATPLHGARRGKMRPAEPGERGALEAITDYEVRRRWNTPWSPVALIEASPHTGRLHQIRVHLRSIGCPLLVDHLYGRSERVTERDLGLPGDRVACSRLTLHALRIEFSPPGRGDRVSVEAPLPDDLNALAEALERTS